MNNPKVLNDRKIIDAVVARLNFYLKNKNINQHELALMCNLPYPTIKSILQKKSNGINLRTIILISHGLGIPPWEFIKDKSFLAENLNID